MRHRRTTRSRRSPSRAFSLLELIVAIAILSIGLVGVLQALSQGLNTVRAADDRTTAVELAEQRLAELTLDPELEPGTDDGDFGETYERFRWESSVEETELEGLLRVTATVYWSSGAREYSVELETCYAPGLLNDTAADPAATEQALDDAATGADAGADPAMPGGGTLPPPGGGALP